MDNSFRPYIPMPPNPNRPLPPQYRQQPPQPRPSNPQFGQQIPQQTPQYPSQQPNQQAITSAGMRALELQQMQQQRREIESRQRRRDQLERQQEMAALDRGRVETVEPMRVPLSGISERITENPGYYIRALRSMIHDNVTAFCARDEFELISAVSSALKMHMYSALFIVDNTTGFIPDRLNPYIESLLDKAGEDYVNAQSSGVRVSTFEGHGIPGLKAFRLDFDLFDDADEVNEACCFYTELGRMLRKTTNDDTELALELAKWFMENSTYVSNGKPDKHSFVTLFQNKQGVVQAIAVAATKVLRGAGISARYVSSDKHAWVVAKIDGHWEQLDYTQVFGYATTNRLNLGMLGVPASERKFFPDASHDFAQTEEITRYNKVLRNTIFEFQLGDSKARINGATVDTTDFHKLCITQGRKVLVAIYDLVMACGGSYVVIGDEVNTYIGDGLCRFPRQLLVNIGGTTYMRATNLARAGFKVDIDDDDKIIVQWAG